MQFIPGFWRTGSVVTHHIGANATGNVGGGEDDLLSRNVSANVLNRVDKTIRITAWGTKANNANAKTLRLYFGTAVILTHALGAGAAGVWKIIAEVTRTGVDAQKYIATLIGTDTDAESGTAAQDDGAEITVKCTGAAVANNDIVQEALIVEVLNI